MHPNKPRRKLPKQVTGRSDVLAIERIYRPDTEKQIAGLCVLLGLPYAAPTQKAA